MHRDLSSVVLRLREPDSHLRIRFQCIGLVDSIVVSGAEMEDNHRDEAGESTQRTSAIWACRCSKVLDLDLVRGASNSQP